MQVCVCVCVSDGYGFPSGWVLGTESRRCSRECERQIMRSTEQGRCIKHFKVGQVTQWLVFMGEKHLVRVWSGWEDNRTYWGILVRESGRRGLGESEQKVSSQIIPSLFSVSSWVFSAGVQGARTQQQASFTAHPRITCSQWFHMSTAWPGHTGGIYHKAEHTCVYRTTRGIQK